MKEYQTLVSEAGPITLSVILIWHKSISSGIVMSLSFQGNYKRHLNETHYCPGFWRWLIFIISSCTNYTTWDSMVTETGWSWLEQSHVQFFVSSFLWVFSNRHSHVIQKYISHTVPIFMGSFQMLLQNYLSKISNSFFSKLLSSWARHLLVIISLYISHF